MSTTPRDDGSATISAEQFDLIYNLFARMMHGDVEMIQSRTRLRRTWQSSADRIRDLGAAQGDQKSEFGAVIRPTDGEKAESMKNKRHERFIRFSKYFSYASIAVMIC